VAAHDRQVQRWHLADLDGVVLAGNDRLGKIVADLLGVDVEGRDELQIPYVVRAELHVHQARHPRARAGARVILDALDERTRAIAYTHDGHAYRTHLDCFLSFTVPL